MNKSIPAAVVDDGSLYKAERKIYPRDVQGRFARLRMIAVWVLLGMYYLFPWLRWDGRQAVLFDLPARKFYVFGLNFWPQDFFFLAVLLILAGLSLFFFTALAGRLWCGYACPQTVWTEVFLHIERWCEGERNRRMRLDAGPWTREKLLRKGSKHVLWLVFALWTGFTFVGFFSPIRDLAARLPSLQWGGWETFWVLFYALATWGNAGVLREQVCKYMCPYARFQSAMFDRNTLIIAYDPMRGEPRGARKRGLASVLERGRGLLPLPLATAAVVDAAHRQSLADARLGARVTTGIVVDQHDELPPAPVVQSPEDLGDCIDCTICVQVCPTGIDIRNGLQYECIACGACIDACDAVMDKMGYPRGLIRYSTQNAIDGRPQRVLRPRVLVYGLLLSAIFVAWVWGITHREALIVDVLRDRNALYRVAVDGRIENAYTLKLINKTTDAHRYRIELRDGNGQPAAHLHLIGAPIEVAAASEEVLTLALTVQADPGSMHGRSDLRFVVRDIDDARVQVSSESRFFGPSP